MQIIIIIYIKTTAPLDSYIYAPSYRATTLTDISVTCS